MGYGYGACCGDRGHMVRWEGPAPAPQGACAPSRVTSAVPPLCLWRALQGHGALGRAKGGTGVTGRWAISLDSATCLASDLIGATLTPRWVLLAALGRMQSCHPTCQRDAGPRRWGVAEVNAVGVLPGVPCCFPTA